MCTGLAEVARISAFSMTMTFSPRVTAPPSAVITAPWSTWQSAPIVTSPLITAVGGDDGVGVDAGAGPEMLERTLPPEARTPRRRGRAADACRRGPSTSTKYARTVPMPSSSVEISCTATGQRGPRRCRRARRRSGRTRGSSTGFFSSRCTRMTSIPTSLIALADGLGGHVADVRDELQLEVARLLAASRTGRGSSRRTARSRWKARCIAAATWRISVTVLSGVARGGLPREECRVALDLDEVEAAGGVDHLARASVRCSPRRARDSSDACSCTRCSRRCPRSAGRHARMSMP